MRPSSLVCLAALTLSAALPANAQHRAPHSDPTPTASQSAPSDAPLRVVFHLLDVSHLGTVYAMQNIAAAIEHADPTTRFVVVVTGAGVMFFRRSEPNNVSVLLAAMVATGRVEFRIDGVSLTRANAPGADLLPGIAIVPSGLLEIARLEHEGYAYVLQ